MLCPILSSADRDRPLMRKEPDPHVASSEEPLCGVGSHPYVFHIGSSRFLFSVSPPGRFSQAAGAAEASRLGSARAQPARGAQEAARDAAPLQEEGRGQQEGQEQGEQQGRCCKAQRW